VKLAHLQLHMTAKTTRSPVAGAKARGAHAERSAQMRQRLIEATVTCLRRVGYAATTTQLVMEEAGVSRGAMLHHFPTKVDLIVAVGEAAALHQNRHVRHRLAEAAAGMERYLLLTRATWEAICEPPALALIEIMMASRSDPALGERFAPIAEKLEAEQRDGVWNLARDLGVRDRDTIDRMVRLHLGAMRGLAIEVMFTGDKDSAEAAITLLEDYTRKLTGELLTR
jgi:AcrR family transcriptional regulator